MPRSPAPVAGVSGSAFFWNALLFTRALRAEGITTDIGAAIDYSRALTLIDIGDRQQVQAAGMAIFVRRRDEVPVYEEVFARFWQRYELAIEPMSMDFEIEGSGADHAQASEIQAGDVDGDDVVSSVTGNKGADADSSAEDDEADGSMSWSERERLSHKPFDRMSPDELRDAERLVDQVRPRLEMRRARRQELHRHGRAVAARQMFRANLQNGGDLLEWLWRRPAMRPRSITVIRRRAPIF